MSDTPYHEPARTIPVLGAWDIVVCGGGPAGCAAAVAAARHGARTLLIEREGVLGGAPVTQYVTPILSTNGVDFQGLWHEWARALQRYDGIAPLSRQQYANSLWFVGAVDPVWVPYAWDDLLTAAGGELLHLAWCVGAIVDAGVMRGVLVETRAGRRAVYAQRVIDATGDGEVCAAAGVRWEQGVAGAPWAMGVSLNACYGGVRTAPDYRPGTPNPEGGTGRSLGNSPLFQAGMLRLLRVDPLDPWQLTEAMRQGRREICARFLAKKAQPQEQALFLADIARQPGVRASRRVHGMTTASDADAWHLHHYADGIARASWEIDIHPADRATGKGVEFDDPAYQPRVQRIAVGDYFDIRYGCLVANGVDHLLVAGRCLSADPDAQASLRIQQTCLATGQAAGVAAAMSLQAGVAPRTLNPLAVVAQLARDRDAVDPAFACLHDLPLAP